MAIFNFRKQKKSADQPLVTASTVEPQPQTTTPKFVPRLAGLKASDQGPAKEEGREEILARMRKRNEQRRHALIYNTPETPVEESHDTLTVPTIPASPLASPIRPSFEDVLAQWRTANAATALPQSNVHISLPTPESSVEDYLLMPDVRLPKASRGKSYATHHSASDSGYDSRTPSHKASDDDLGMVSSAGAGLSVDSNSSLSSSVYTDGDIKDDSPLPKEEEYVDDFPMELSECNEQPKSERGTSSAPLPNELDFEPHTQPQAHSADMTALPRYVPSLSPIIASPRKEVENPILAPSSTPLSVLQGYKVNKKGKVLDEEGEVIGELVSGDILDCVRQRVDDNGQVLDDRGKVVGTVKPVGAASEEEQKPEEKAAEATNTHEEAVNASPISAQDSVFEVPMSAKRAGKLPKREQTPSLQSLNRRTSPTNAHPANREFEEPRLAPPRPNPSLRRIPSQASTFSTFSSVSAAALCTGQRRGSEQTESSQISEFATIPYIMTTPAAAPRSQNSIRSARSSLGPSSVVAKPQVPLRPSTSNGGESTIPDFTTMFSATPVSRPTQDRRSVERERNPFSSRYTAAPVLPPIGRMMSPVPENNVAPRHTGNMAAGGGMFSYKGEIPTGDGLPIQRKLASAPAFVPGSHLPINHNPAPSAFNNPKIHALRGLSHQPNTPAIPPRSAARPPSLHGYASSISATAPPTPISEASEVASTDWATMYPAPAIPTGGLSVYGAHSRPSSLRSSRTGRPRSYFTHRGKVAVEDGEEEEVKTEESKTVEGPMMAEVNQEAEKPIVAAEPEKKRRLFGKKK
ncbi:unnamed protein product [Zymoseptoria tritici ST99CH_1A5]|uniref:Uncharacterized protein n=1 Tax=Zymoseptoria tritici ST99CH_1A5 TaxID=1276529 RepID=A0A1Y6LF67_ZYMTR|nr:unnamed protein product [Zymoseptoria tritici ST99CH_1A5]